MIYCLYEDEKGVHHAVRVAHPKFHFRANTKAKVRSKASKRVKEWIDAATSASA